MGVDRKRLRPHRRKHWGVEPDPEPEPQLELPRREVVEPTIRRRILWRDSATILIGMILALLTFQVLAPDDAGLTSDPTDFPTEVAIGITPPPMSLAPGETIGPIVDPSLGIDATPTPVPVITLGPTPTAGRTPVPTPRITPRITPRPTRTPAATPKPPTPPPPTPPPPTPTPTPPPPTVSLTCVSPVALTVECTASPNNHVPGSQLWSMGGAGTILTGGNGTNAVTFIYDTSGAYTITITITGLDGSTASDSFPITV